jgi:hypothetical protein
MYKPKIKIVIFKKSGKAKAIRSILLILKKNNSPDLKELYFFFVNYQGLFNQRENINNILKISKLKNSLVNKRQSSLKFYIKF